MNEKIEIEDWVQHKRFRLVGQVKKITVKDGKKILKVQTNVSKSPLQSWEEENVKITAKGK